VDLIWTRLNHARATRPPLTITIVNAKFLANSVLKLNSIFFNFINTCFDSNFVNNKLNSIYFKVKHIFDPLNISTFILNFFNMFFFQILVPLIMFTILIPVFFK
jgi:hypothetical protein